MLDFTQENSEPLEYDYEAGSSRRNIDNVFFFFCEKDILLIDNHWAQAGLKWKLWVFYEQSVISIKPYFSLKKKYNTHTI